MSAESVIAQGQVFAESTMTDTCQIGTETVDGVLNETTGQYETTFSAVYEGPCRFKAGNTQAAEVDAAGQLLVEQESVLKLPVGSHPDIITGASSDVAKGMVVVMTGSLTDPGLPGVRARIKGPAVGSYLTARRFAVEVTS